MNTTLSAWMKLALTAVVISALIWHKLYPALANMADKVVNFIP